MTAPTRPRRPGNRSGGRPSSAPGVVTAAPRLAARAKAERADRRRRRWRWVLRALVVLLPLLGVAWVVLLSTWLAVDRVEVTGVARLSAEQVVEAAAVGTGTPLARVDAGDVAERLRGLAPVQDVRVERDWPSTLHLVVTERVPVAGVAGEGAVRLVDAGAVPFADEPALPAGLPLLEVAAPGPDDAATRAALGVLTDLPPALRDQVTVVRASTASGVELGLSDGRTVVWGEPGGTATKVAALEALLRMPGTVFDVSAPGVVVRR